ncbi:MAG: hypothetical protein CMH59_15545, partial [Myxococcales bacterium]|nr:hypothetical protein [Myxococcales bacterium]
MGWFADTKRLWRTLRHRERRRWHRDHRVHLELRPCPSELAESFAAAVEASFASRPGVAWARVNAPLRRLVVQLGPDADLEAEAASLDAMLGEVEARFDLDQVEFVDDAREHPGDEEPLERTRVELAGDGLGVALGLGMRVARVRTVAAEIDLAALVSALENVPGARKALEDRLGRGTAELALQMASTLSSALLQGAVGPGVDAIRRALRLRELRARREAWDALEERLCGDPDAHPRTVPDVGERPAPLPPGPIERYADKAVVAMLGSFGFGLASSQSLAGASASIFGGVPKPAFLGREAFGRQLSTVLARRGVLVLDRDALRRLDRIDALLVDDALVPLAGPLDPDLVALTGRARREKVRLYVQGAERTRAERIRARRIAPAEGETGPLGALRRLQRQGRTVAYLGGDAAALAAADLGVGVASSGGPVPFGADVLCPGGLRDARHVLAAVGPARTASRQSVQMAVVEVATGLLLSLGGLDERNVRRVMLAAHGASLLSIANGVRLADTVVEPPRGPRAPSGAWHAEETGAVLEALGSAPTGLSAEEVSARTPPEKKPRTPARKYGELMLDELTNPFTPILAAGAGLSALTGSLIDAGMVGGVMGLNTVLGAAQRFRTERQLEKLFQDEQRDARVRRDGRLERVDHETLVWGDVIELEAGEVVPADCRILEARGLEVDESSLTGESLPVGKGAAPSRAEAVAERSSMLYMGTTIAAGEAVAVVVATGEETEARRGLADGDGGDAGGVEKRLEDLTELTAPVAAAAGLLVIAAGAARGRNAADMIGAGVSLAVAAVPEGLPLLATMAQLAAAKRLSARGAVVRNPRAIEALGRVDVLCADKTGTLTEGRIQLRAVFDGETHADVDALDEAHRRVVAVAYRATPSADEEGPLPHLTDRALAEGAARLGVEAEHGASGWASTSELPFEPGRGYHAVAGLKEGGERLLCVKGAPEVILARCDRKRREGADAPLSDAEREALVGEAERMAERGLRVLAVADRPLHEARDLDEARVGTLRFRGFVGLSDPVRATAKAALADLREAGVDVVMITGDHPKTAAAIARELHLATDHVLTGPELEAMDDDALRARLADVRVFARVTPSQKVRIVRAFQAAGRVVGMTGDGANDAQAIRLAEVGIALGDASTGAARAAADLVVVDGRIESIVDAVLEGRALWRSVRDAVAILVGGNLGEIAFTVVGGLAAGRSPLNARQLLLVNLLTDALPALAVALRPPESVSPEELLEEGPEASLGEPLERDILFRGAITGGAAAAAWFVARALGDRRGADTVAMLSLVGAQLGQTVVAGTRSKLVLGTGFGSLAALLGVVQTPGLSGFFGSRPLGPLGLAQA